MTIDEVEPHQVWVTSRGGARLRVRGRGVGVLVCQGQLRWVCGAFDETFLVHKPSGPFRVRAFGVTGVHSSTVIWAPRVDIHPPIVRRATFLNAPPIRRLQLSVPRTPRLRRLHRDDALALAGAQPVNASFSAGKEGSSP